MKIDACLFLLTSLTSRMIYTSKIEKPKKHDK